MKRIASITRYTTTDTDPDLSYWGEYSNDPGPNAIDRQERGDMGRNELRYCNIAMSAEETGNPASVEHDYQRLEAYNRGEWYMMGLFAVARIEISRDGKTWQSHKIMSGGIYGVESDGGEIYQAQMFEEELESLRDSLLELGFTLEEINGAVCSTTS